MTLVIAPLSALLEGLIDYAGLFPPASLSMEEALRNYDRYRHGEHARMLGRFIVPEGKLDQVPEDVPVSVLADDVREYDRVVDSIETKKLPVVSASVPVYVEGADLDDLARLGLHAKIRTGGVTADAFPSADDIASFIQQCREKNVAFKATAGLHHPVRCVKPLTYAADAPRGTMHGFLNVFFAALFPDAAREILLEDDPKAFVLEDESIGWRVRRASTLDVVTMRKDFAHSFGSCSFEEPVADLKEIGWL
jgi:hypothetical protein